MLFGPGLNSVSFTKFVPRCAWSNWIGDGSDVTFQWRISTETFRAYLSDRVYIRSRADGCRYRLQSKDDGGMQWEATRVVLRK